MLTRSFALHAVWCLVIACGTLAHAAIRYVNVANPTPVFPYTNGWASAATNVQEGIDAAAADDVVLVTNGLYQLASNTQVVVTKRITLRSVNRHGAVIRAHPDLGRCVYLSAPGAVVDGFTLTGGRTLNVEGGGVYLYHYGTLQNCLVTGNYSSGYFLGAYGGGVYVSYGGLVSNCVVRANRSAGSGGGIYMYRGGAAVYCTVLDNVSGFSAGGVSLQYGTVAHNCLIAGNSALHGGGVDTYSTSVIQNCTITRNRAAWWGGGVRSGPDATFDNCIILDNSAPEQENFVDGPLRFLNCSTSPDLASVNASNTVFGDPEFNEPASNDYHLLPGSACVDAGGNRAWMGSSIDLDGHARILHGTVDIGAYEADQTVPACNFIAAQRQQFIGQPVVFQPHMWAFHAANITCQWDFTNDGVMDAVSYGLQAVTTSYGAQGVYSVRMQMSDGPHTMTRRRYNYITIGPTDAYVSQAGGHVAPYLAWPQAARDLQSALDVAVDGTRIHVSNEVFQVTNEIRVSRGVWIKSIGPGPAAVLDGGLPGRTGRCVRLQHTNAVLDGFTIQCAGYPYQGSTGGAVIIWQGGTLQHCALVSNVAGTGSAVHSYRGGALLDCLVSNCFGVNYGKGSVHCDGRAVVRDCRIVRNRQYNGGGLIVFGAAVSNCVISDNVASSIYGGMYAGAGLGGWSRVQHCMISNNVALDNRAGGAWIDFAIMEDSQVIGNYASNNYSYGGGVLLSGGTLQRCVVRGNRADYAAGVSSLDGTVHNVLIADNHAIGPKVGRSGGLEANRGNVRDCLIVRNTATKDGGGARFAAGIFYLAWTTMFANCTIVSNSAGGNGGGLYLETGATSTLYNTIIAHNLAPVTSNCYLASTNWDMAYCCTTPLPAGPGNVAADPLLVDPAAGDWRLRAASPCRDAGTNAPWMLDFSDMAGVPRILYGVVDIGAYEYAEGLWCTFSAAPTYALVDAPVAFAGSGGGTNTSGLYYRWDFDHDGSVDVQGPGSNAPLWRYAGEGVYDVALLLSNAAGETALCVREDYVTIVPEPGAPALAGAVLWYVRKRCRARPNRAETAAAAKYGWSPRHRRRAETGDTPTRPSSGLWRTDAAR
jgi:PKD repeat protein